MPHHPARRAAFAAPAPLAVRLDGGGCACACPRLRYVCSAAAPGAAAAGAAGRTATKFRVAVLAGDGIGPEIAGVAVRALDAAGAAAGVTLEYSDALVGGAALDAAGEPLPAATLATCRGADAVLLACIGGPKWDGLARAQRPESGLLALRRALGLFANLRPAAVLPELVGASTLRPDVVAGVDLMVVRELTGGVYFGAPKALARDPATGRRVGYNNMIYHEHEVARIARVAFGVARSRGGRLCSVDKANVLDVSQLWRDVVSETAAGFPDVELSHMYVDNAAMQLIRAPRQFDTIVTGNLFGDILSDAAAMLVGSLGMLPSASLGDGSGPGLFEPVHGSAPDIAGQDLANPIAAVLSAAMMMRYGLGRADVADSLERAVRRALADGFRTGDIMADGMTRVGCAAMGDAIIERITPA